jgi:catechol 2,3-dioxygenase-like lactoylglutathione lyase family enzyme
MQTTLLLVAALFVAVPAFGQLAAPNSAGVAAGHVHLNVSDMDVQQKFWTQLGGKIVNREKIVMAQFPGIYVLLRKQDFNGGSVGSAVNHFGFYVKNFDESVAKWKALGMKWEDGPNRNGFITGPDNVRIEIYENKTMAVPMQMHHIHLFVTDPIAAQKWYVQHFGATPGKRAQFDTATVPGAEITLAKADTPQAPTKGRSVDHIGFEVKNIDAFVAKLQAAGIKTDGPIRNSTNAAGIRLTYVTDPWGTEIEITEGLATPKS